MKKVFTLRLLLVTILALALAVPNLVVNVYAEDDPNVGESMLTGWENMESLGTDIWGCNYGMMFTTAVQGYITHIKVFGLEGDYGDHTAYIWENETGNVVGGPYTINYTGSNEWVVWELPEPVFVSEAGKMYTVMVTPGETGLVPVIREGVSQAGNNGISLYYPANAGVFGPLGTDRPTVSWRWNYLRDIVFAATGINPIVLEVNAATDLTSMRAAIEGSNSRWLELESYNRLDDDSKNSIAQSLLDAKAYGYRRAGEIQDIIDMNADYFVGLKKAEAVAQVNSANGADNLRDILTNPFLELSFTLYDTLSEEQKTGVLNDLITVRPAQGFANIGEIRDRFDSLIRDLLYNQLVPYDQDFFPIGVWMQNTSESRIQQYKDIGINTYVNLSDGASGFNESAYNTLKNSGMKAIVYQNDYARNNMDKAREVVLGWFLRDEPDNARTIAGWPNIPLPPEELQNEYAVYKSYDQTLPVYVNFSKGIADPNGYKGRGPDTRYTYMYPEYAKGADILSYDIYCSNDGHPLSFIGAGVDNLYGYSNGKQPVWAFIETTKIRASKGTRPTPEQVKAQVWIALVHGAKGIQYFAHQIDPFVEPGMLMDEYTDIREMVASVNQQITELAPVLNSPSTSGYATVESGNEDVSIHMMTKDYNNNKYIFAVCVDDDSTAGGSTTGTFSVASGSYVEVLGEARVIPIVNGRFSDDFDPHGVHLYKVIEKEETITVTGPDSIEKGQTFTVNIGFISEKKVLTAEIGIGYNDELVEYVDYTPVEGGLSMIASGEGDPENPNTKRRFVLAGEGDPITDGVLLLQLIFKAKETTGPCEIEVTKAELGAEGETEGKSILLLPSLDGIVIQITEVHVPGDITGDSIVNVLDLYEVAYNYWKTSADADWDNVKKADVSGEAEEGVPDGKIDFADLVYVARKILE